MTQTTIEPADTPSPKRASTKARIAIIIGVVIMALIVAGVFAFVTFQPIQVLPRIRLAPGFAMVDERGDTLTSEDMRGRFVLYGFSYTACETCESAMETMQEIQDRLPEADLRGFPVSLVTISVDPERDDPAALAAYAEANGADPELWSFATTESPDLLKAIVGGGFRTYYEGQDDGSISLDRMFVLVDGNGIVRGQYRYQTQVPDTDRILRHFGVLAEEAENANGAAGLAYEAAHFFLCYAP